MDTATGAKIENASTTAWTDPGFFSKKLGRGGNLWRLIWFMIVPPDGHRTVPTPAGYVLILVALGLGSAAYNTASNILFMALSLLLSSLILSGLLSWLNFSGARWRLILPSSFRAGRSANIEIELRNEKRFLPTYSLWFNVAAKQAEDKRRIYLDDRLNPGKHLLLHWEFTPEKRGVEELLISGLESQFPFGFLKKKIGGGISREVVVLPKRVAYEFNVATGIHSPMVGETNRKKGNGAELVNIRRYQPGDSQRLVHWKASARTQTLMVKQMAEENKDGFILHLETPASLWQDAEQFERLCSFAASLAEDLFKQGRLLALAVNEQTPIAMKKLSDLQTALEQLGRLDTSEHYKSNEAVSGANVVTFHPSALQRVVAILKGESVGEA